MRGFFVEKIKKGDFKKMRDFRETARFIGVTDSRRKLVRAGHPDIPEATSSYALLNGVPVHKSSGERVILTSAHMTIFAGGRLPRSLERSRYETMPPGTAVWRRRVRKG